MNENPFLSSKIQESLERLKKSLELNSDKSEKLEVNKSDLKPILESVDKTNKEQLHNIKDTLFFLRAQGKKANKQFKTSKNLVIISLILMLFQIFHSFWVDNKYNERLNNTNKVFEMKLKSFETISQMSLNLLDLHNQVRILEKQNEQLK
jgi:hypothetical protein|tara:strand:+ start:95 stop:544 length:450 start_codon:yes stop_codon:yes gene_type:complete